MKLISYINTLEQKKLFFLLLLFAATLLLRLPTLFNDFYDVDELSAIVQTHEYMAGEIPGVDFKESKLPLYHVIFKTAYKIMPNNGWVMVHIFTIFIVYFTAFFIYLIGKRIHSFRAGATASLLYAVLISSFNRHFMATNGEIVYNLPIIAGLFFFILYINEINNTFKKFIFFFISLVMGLCAAMVKFHGVIYFIFLALLFIIYIPYYKQKITLKYISLLAFLLVIFSAATIFDYFSTNFFAQKLISEAAGKLTYSSVKGFNPYVFSAKYIHRQFLLGLWHFVVWIPATVSIFQFAKNKFRFQSLPVSAVAILFILTYIMIFGGGSRLYFHYFIAVYPVLCIIGTYSLFSYNIKIIKKIQNKFTALILIPAIFFFVWNSKDIIIKHFFPQAFYKEGKTIYWMRAVLVGTFNDYLLPDASYKNACEYIKSITKPDDKIFVWGDGPYLYYFSQRRIGITHVWPKTGIYRITSLYEKGDIKSIVAAEQMERGFIDTIKKKKPVLFIDTSENGLSTFYYKVTPLLNEYINNNYSYIKEVDKIKFYRIAK